MTEYQELFNKITKEISDKRKTLPSLKQQIDESEEKYNRLFEDITNLQETLVSKKEELEEMPCKHDNKIFYKTYIPGVLLTSIVAITIVILSMNFISYFQISTALANILTSISGLLGIILPSITASLIIRKTFKKLLKESHDKIKDSPEYKELLNEINKLENNLSVKKSLQRTEEIHQDETKKEYNLALTEIKMKEALLEYLRNEKKAPLNNNEDEKEEIRIPKRTRKKD